MNVLLLGSGGREHALAWKITQSPLLDTLWIAPGNPGTSQLGINLDISLSDFDAIRSALHENNIQMLIVGPEGPLADGIVDEIRRDDSLAHVMIMGPGQKGAMLESSKDFAKAFMMRHQIPTAAYSSFDVENLSEGLQFLETLKGPWGLKADGLAAGKGVAICQDLDSARKELTEMLEGRKFGKASEKVVIEEFLSGTELSVFVITNGIEYQMLPEAKDYKRIGEKDTGPNTGGMGAVSPVPFATNEFISKVEERIIKPTVSGLSKEGIPYIGFIFFGLINVNNDPYVIEYNVRMGDPETEVVMPRLKTDLLELFLSAYQGNLSALKPEFLNETAATVMLVSGGYPGSYQTGFAIEGTDDTEQCILFHAGTRLDKGTLRTAGGRVIAVTCLGPTIQKAFESAYGNAGKILFQDKYMRYDLGKDLLKS